LSLLVLARVFHRGRIPTLLHLSALKVVLLSLCIRCIASHGVELSVLPSFHHFPVPEYAAVRIGHNPLGHYFSYLVSETSGRTEIFSCHCLLRIQVFKEPIPIEFRQEFASSVLLPGHVVHASVDSLGFLSLLLISGPSPVTGTWCFPLWFRGVADELGVELDSVVGGYWRSRFFTRD